MRVEKKREIIARLNALNRRYKPIGFPLFLFFMAKADCARASVDSRLDDYKRQLGRFIETVSAELDEAVSESRYLISGIDSNTQDPRLKRRLKKESAFIEEAVKTAACECLSARERTEVILDRYLRFAGIETGAAKTNFKNLDSDHLYAYFKENIKGV